jgi:HEAT repeat protein
MGVRVGRGFQHVVVADLSPSDKDDFARRWCALTEMPERRDPAAADLIRDIHSSGRIEQLTGNPMLLTTLALVKRKVGKLPRRRADLYWEAVQVLLNWRSEVDEPLDVREALPQLEYLAYAMCERGVQRLREEEILETLDRMRAEYPQIHGARVHTPGQFLALLERRTGILVEAGHVRHLGMTMPVFEFRHLTFQEYLAARALVDGRFPGRDRSRSLAEHVAPLAGCIAFTRTVPWTDVPVAAEPVSTWHETLRLCVSCCSDDAVDELLRAILTPLPVEEAATERPRAVLAALCLADEPNASIERTKEVLAALVQKIRSSDGKGGEQTGVDRACTELATTRWAPELRRLLLAEFRRRDGEARAPFGAVCGAVIAAALPPDGGSGAIRDWLTAQVEVLAGGGDVAVEAALGIMDLAYREQAMLVPGLVDGLLSMLGNDASASYAAAWALAWLARHAEWPLVDLDRLTVAIADVSLDPQTVRLLTEIVGLRRHDFAVDVLIPRLDHPDSAVRKAACMALARIADARAVEAAVDTLDRHDTARRRSAVATVGRIAGGRVVDALLGMLQDVDVEVRRTAAGALERVGDARAATTLVDRLADTDADVRRAAIVALDQIGDAVQSLLAVLNDDNPEVRHAAAGMLGRVLEPRAVRVLSERLEDPDGQVRRVAKKVLGRDSGPRTVEMLVARLLDEESDEVERRAAARVLGRLGSSDAVHALTSRLESSVEPAEDVRQAAMDALAQIGDADAVTALKTRLFMPDMSARTEAVRALSLSCRDEVDRRLLSRDFDERWPFLDPWDPIGDHRVRTAAAALGMSVEEVCRRYEVLARRFWLRIDWDSS